MGRVRIAFRVVRTVATIEAYPTGVADLSTFGAEVLARDEWLDALVLVDVASEANGAAPAIQLRTPTRFDHRPAEPRASVRVRLAAGGDAGVPAVVRGARGTRVENGSAAARCDRRIGAGD